MPRYPGETKCPRPGKCGPPAPTAPAPGASPEEQRRPPGGRELLARLRRLPESARAAPPGFPFVRPPRHRERFPGGGRSRIGLRWGRPGAAGAPLQGLRGCRPPARPPPRTPAGSPPPLRPTRFRAASLGEAAAGPPPGAGSSLARPGGPGHPRRPPPARAGAARARRAGLRQPPNSDETNFLLVTWKKGRNEENRRKTGVGGERGEGDCRWLDWRGSSFRFLFPDVREEPLC